MDILISDYFNDDGTVNIDGPGLLSLAGEDHADSKVFDDIKDVAGLIKSHADTKSKLGKKLENVIQRPAENATDEQKAEFRKLLLKELGSKESAEELNITVPDLPEGMIRNDDLKNKWTGRFIEMGMPESMIQQCISHFVVDNIQTHNERIKAENEAFETSVKDFRNNHRGVKEIEFVRVAHDALMRFASADTKMPDGTQVKGLKTLIKEADLFTNPTDYKKWRDLGINPDQLELWGNIGNRMKSGFSLKDEDAAGKGEKTDKQTAAEIYDHPTSQKELIGQT